MDAQTETEPQSCSCGYPCEEGSTCSLASRSHRHTRGHQQCPGMSDTHSLCCAQIKSKQPLASGGQPLDSAPPAQRAPRKGALAALCLWAYPLPSLTTPPLQEPKHMALLLGILLVEDQLWLFLLDLLGKTRLGRPGRGTSLGLSVLNFPGRLRVRPATAATLMCPPSHGHSLLSVHGQVSLRTLRHLISYPNPPVLGSVYCCSSSSGPAHSWQARPLLMILSLRRGAPVPRSSPAGNHVEVYISVHEACTILEWPHSSTLIFKRILAGQPKFLHRSITANPAS